MDELFVDPNFGPRPALASCSARHKIQHRQCWCLLGPMSIKSQIRTPKKQLGQCFLSAWEVFRKLHQEVFRKPHQILETCHDTHLLSDYFNPQTDSWLIKSCRIQIWVRPRFINPSPTWRSMTWRVSNPFWRSPRRRGSASQTAMKKKSRHFVSLGKLLRQ